MLVAFVALFGVVSASAAGVVPDPVSDVWSALLRIAGGVPQRTPPHSALALSGSSSPVPPVAFAGPVPPARCGPGSSPQDGLDGEVPLADRLDGRSSRGYWCNLKLVGQYQGQGASWVSQSYRTCEYMPTRWPSPDRSPGVQVLNVTDPAHPTLAGTLTTTAMIAPWESLKVNARRGLLAAVSGGAGVSDASFDIYDIKTNCLKPRLLGSITAGQLLTDLPTGLKNLPTDLNAAVLFGHEGNWSPDGNTYWASGLLAGWLSAIDVRDPTHPRIIWTGSTGLLDHGFSLSDDGDTLYMAEVGNIAETLTGVPSGTFKSVEPNGLAVFNVADIQDRAPDPTIHQVGHVYWTDGGVGQMSIPITYQGNPYLVFVDEFDEGGVRIISLANPADPYIVSKLKLQIQMPANIAIARRDTKGTGLFTYDSHYCAVNRENNPTALACGYFDSGIRVFDISNPASPREIAYYNPPAQLGKNAMLTGSEHAGGVAVVAVNDVENGGDIGKPALQPAIGPPVLNVDWCSSPPEFVGTQIWVTCQDNGFMVLRFTNGAYPITAARPDHPSLTRRAGFELMTERVG